MNRTALTSAAVVTVASAAAVALALPPGTADAGTRVHTATYSLPLAGAQSKFVGADEDHPVVGDRFVESYRVLRRGHLVGHSYNVCTLAAGSTEADSVGQCVFTFVLPGGQLTSVGTPGNGRTSVTPIAGGTGRFAYATGTATTTFASGAARLTLRYVSTR